MRVTTCFALMLLVSASLFGQDSLNVTCVSQYPLWGYCSDVAVLGHFAYVANDNALGVVDISDPHHPRPVAFLNACRSAAGLAVKGHYLYVVMQDSGIAVVDILSPTHPVKIGQFATSGWMPGHVTVVGDLVVAVDYPRSGSAQLDVIDMSNPSSPSLLGQVSMPGICAYVGITVRDSLVYFSAEYSGLYVVDIHRPSAPVVLGHSSDVGYAADVAVDGHFAYVATEYSGLHIVDIANPSAPVEVASFDDWPCQSTGVEIRGCNLYLSNFAGPFRILNISDPLHPLSLSLLDLAPCGSEEALAVVGQTAYTVTECGELIAIDVSQPCNPAEIGRWATPCHEACDVAISGNTLAVSAYWRYYGCGLVTMDASDPNHLTYSSYLAGGEGEYPGCVSEHGGHFFVGQAWSDRSLDDMNGGFVIVDASNPAAPRELSELDDLDAVTSIAFSGNYAYALCGADYMDSSRVFAIDVHDPTRPAVVGSAEIRGHGTIAVADSILLMASDRGLGIYRISDPRHIVPIDTTLFPRIELTAVALFQRYALVSSAPDSLYVIDLAVPSAPVIVVANPEPSAQDITIAADRAYLACGSAGLRVVDIADPTRPAEIGYYASPGGAATRITLQDSLVYLADNSFIGVYRCTVPERANTRTETVPQTFSLSAYPNPFNPNTVLSFDVPRSGKITLSVYDITGRLVQTLADRVYPQGSYRVTFDGSKLASGIYFARLQGNRISRTQKLVLLK